MSEEIQLVLLSGLGADERVFADQKLVLPNLIVPPWIVPEPNESMEVYSQRMAEVILDMIDCPSFPLVIGGASFGGILSLELAKYLKPDAVILIGSVRSPAEIPLRLSFLRIFKWCIRLLPMPLIQWAALLTSRNPVGNANPHLAGVADQFARANPDVVRWSARQILEWSEEPRVDCPVYHIHGRDDRAFPVRNCSPDEIIDQAGHVISMTHPREVNAFIGEVMTLVG